MTANASHAQPDPTKNRIVFSVVTGPTTKSWPINGQFIVKNPDGHLLARSQHLFSVAATRAALQEMVTTHGIVTPDAAVVTEAEAREIGLREERSRYDRIVSALSIDERRKHALIDLFSGTTTPETGSTPHGRFETCVDESICKQPNCSKYGTHGVLRIAHSAKMRFGELRFSTGAINAAVATGINDGIFLPDDETHIATQTKMIGLVQSNGPTRADKLAQFQTLPKLFGELLDLAFGITKPEKPARFEIYGEDGDEYRRVHLYSHNDCMLGLSGATHYDDALTMLNNAVKNGLIDVANQAELLGQLETFGLLPGKAQDDPNYISQEEQFYEVLLSRL